MDSLYTYIPLLPAKKSEFREFGALGLKSGWLKLEGLGLRARGKDGKLKCWDITPV